MHTTEQQYRLLLEHIPAITYTAAIHPDSCSILFVSPQIESILGFPQSMWTEDQNFFLQQIHQDDKAEFLNKRTESALTSRPFQFEYRIFAADGSIHWVQDQANVVPQGHPDPVLFQGVLVDITNRKHLEEELSRWDHETRSLMDNIPTMVARFDQRFRYLYLNRWFGKDEVVSPEEYIGKTNEGMGLPVEVTRLLEDNLRLVFEKKQSRLVEFSIMTPRGVRFMESHLVPELESQDRVATVLAIIRDLTERKAAQNALRESEQRFRQLAESINDVFWLLDTTSCKIVYVSPAYEREWGASSRALFAEPEAWLKVIHEEDRAGVANRFQQRVVHGNFDAEYRIVHSDGKTRWIHDRAFPIFNGRGEVSRVAGIAQDITERKRLEDERLRSSKLDSLGLLAGGLAHDFNNLLTAILGQLSLAKFSLSPDNPIFDRICEAEKASLRSQDLTQQLLTFAKGGTPVKKSASLVQIVEENSRFVLTGSKVKYHFNIAEDLWTVEIDVGQISQVVQNLVINAMQAMPEGGELKIYGHNVMIGPEGYQDLLGIPVGRWVRLSFVDQGIGIPKEHLVKIFDPYFTTKVTGSGLGLATSYSITKNHGGLLSVDSEVGVGTTFTMFLPATPHAEIPLDGPHAQFQVGKGKILVMDDEASIRGVLSEMLEICGYSYESARDGEEALALFAQAKEKDSPFQAVILDLTIPGGMGGKDVLQKLKQIDPHVMAIVVSGYSNDPVLANFQDYGFKGRVSKPFRLADLSEVIYKVIEHKTMS